MTNDIKEEQDFRTPAFSLSSPECLNNPYPTYEQLRSVHPIYRGMAFKNPGWYVTGYDEALMILKDARFKNRMSLPQTTRKYEALKRVQSDMLLFKNGQDHKRLRLLVSQVFTPGVVESYRSYIEETVHDLLDKVQHNYKLDVIADLAFPLASLVIAKIIGIPAEDRHQFREWAVSLIQTIDFTRSRKALIEGNDTTKSLLVYFKGLIQKRRQNRKQDLISRLIEETQQGDKLTDEEILATCILLIIAGHETTVNLIGDSMLCLLNHPTQLARLKENPSLIDAAVEECLRYESPTQMTARTATEDIEINGVEIKQGYQVYTLLGAANRDPKQFNHPNMLDIARNPNPHLSFGYGTHFCPGSSLARLEAQVAVQILLQRMDHLQIASSDLQWRKLLGFRALKELPLTFG
ncbi:cytochrome P450 [Bacillus sp. FJAT-27231]|uniref:cytochrome P450 n=1 Tax=Bacillus sp. FJAT-27231 TaxID=1679168 RepID=UPI00067140C1|nr:cytochrome P450 [Bacillus sp. FJAT-27231]KMY54497.1 cytochrome P450 [Bacillus sp. FJAT-27231]